MQHSEFGNLFENMLMDTSESVQTAATAIVRLGVDGVPAIRSLLKGTQTQFSALGSPAIGEPAAQAVPDIIELLD